MHNADFVQPDLVQRLALCHHSSPLRMRVKIVAVMHGTIDGIDLAKFEIGRLYDVGTSLGNYLLASGYALPVTDEKPALITPLDDTRTSSELPERNKAADRKPSKKS
jgi:hypothetical protein